ncbi:MAG: LamG domain-containing protein [bacterium]|nr:LamG domain-containing protein [bacterium]
MAHVRRGSRDDLDDRARQGGGQGAAERIQDPGQAPARGGDRRRLGEPADVPPLRAPRTRQVPHRRGQELGARDRPRSARRHLLLGDGEDQEEERQGRGRAPREARARARSAPQRDLDRSHVRLSSRFFRARPSGRIGQNGRDWGITPAGSVFTTLDILDYFLADGPAPGGWRHFAVVFDERGDAPFYLDGATIGKVLGTSPANARGSTYAIGVLDLTTMNEWFNGLIDDLQVHDGSLTAAEIWSLHANPSSTFGTGLAGDPILARAIQGSPNQFGTFFAGTTPAGYIQTGCGVFCITPSFRYNSAAAGHEYGGQPNQTWTFSDSVGVTFQERFGAPKNAARGTESVPRAACRFRPSSGAEGHGQCVREVPALRATDRIAVPVLEVPRRERLEPNRG